MDQLTSENMMKETQIYQTLINQWHAQYKQLHDLLSSEQLALEKRDFVTLEALVSEKTILVQQINLEQIPAIINQGNVSQPNLIQLKNYCLNDKTLTPSWNRLMELVNQCHFKNEVNARLIELVTQSTKRTFNLIKGFDPDNNIYDSQGDQKIVSHYGSSVSA
jgi:flagellar biosynthesis/type III secretory pathway chaperone